MATRFPADSLGGSIMSDQMRGIMHVNRRLRRAPKVFITAGGINYRVGDLTNFRSITQRNGVEYLDGRVVMFTVRGNCRVAHEVKLAS